MLSYQHGYHAGNFADVIKHMALTRLLNYLILKDKPLFYLETHSGKGLYDLRHKQAEKTKEYQQGIQPLWLNKNRLPPVFHEYLHIIGQINPMEPLRYYPGSPFFAINTLRMQDRMYFCELHSGEFSELQQMPTLNKKVHFSHSDGLTALNSLLPPKEKRGLIFIDPSFELKEEYQEIPRVLKKAYTRFSTGVFCLWYPLVNQKLTDKLNRGMKAIQAKKMVHIQFNLSHKPMEGMSGCGLWIINPPFIFAKEMETALLSLKSYFSFEPNRSFYLIEDTL